MALEEHAELVVKTKSGESYTIAESRIAKGSLTASSSCSSGGGIPAGACNIGTASVAFRAPSGLTYKKLYRATVEIYAWYQGYSKELYGTYNVSSAENNYGVYTLSLSDNISLLDESCYAANDTENAENWLYSQMAGRWNVPSVILNYICNAYNVPHYNAAENEKYVPDSGNTALSTGVSSECSVESVKDFANYLAEYLGCFIVAAPDGRVRFSRLGEREYKTELNKSNISRGTLQRSPYYVHPSVWKVSFDSGYGSSWYVSSDLPDDAAPLSINITNNPFWQVQEDRVPADIYGGKVTQMIKYMWDYLYNAAIKKDGNTVEYMINPFSCTAHVPYHFRIGDIVTVRDYVNGDVFRSYLTDITWTFRGGQQISCAGDDTRTLSVGTSRSAAKKSNDYSKYLYRKSKTGSSGGDTNTYTKAEIDAKDASVKSAADKAQATADSAVSVNNTQNTQISALQKSAHAHSNKDVLDKTEQPYTTAERDKLAGLENYVHPAHTAHSKGMYKVAVDDEGHVTEADAVTKDDITALGIPGDKDNYTMEFSITKSDDHAIQDSNYYIYKNGEKKYEIRTGRSGHTKVDIDRCDIIFDFSFDRGFYDLDKSSGYTGGLTGIRMHQSYTGGSRVYGTVEIKGYGDNGQATGVVNGYGTAILYTVTSISCAPTKWDSISEPSKVLIGYDTPDGTDAHLPVYFADDIWCGNDTKSLNAQITEKYTKPAAGIPKSDLASDVQASLGKADTALQKHQDISGKQDKLTAGANITLSGNTISAKDTTYGNASASAAGLMSAADKKKLDGMDLSKYLPLSGTAVKADALSAGHMKYGWVQNSTTTANSGYTWARVAYCETATGYDTITMTMLATSGYAGAGIFSVFYRNSSTGKGCDNIGFEQIFTNKPTKIANEYFKFVAVYTDSGVRYEIWYNTQARWSSAQFTCLAEQAYAGVNTNHWIFEKRDSTAFQTAPPTGNKEATYYNNGVVATATTLTDSGWQVPTFPSGISQSSIRYRKQGKIVSVTGYVKFSASTAAKTVLTLPEGYRPPKKIQQFNAVDSSSQASFLTVIDADGSVRFSGKTQGFFDTTSEYYIHCTFFVD